MNATLKPFVDERSAQLDRALVTTFLENVPDHVFFKDRHSRFIAVSRSMIVDFEVASAAAVIGRTDYDFYTPSHARIAYEDEQRIMRSGQPILNKLEKETWPDGRVTWALTTKLPLRDEAGTIIGTFGVSKDVTESKRLELEIEKAHKALVEANRAAGMAEVATGVLHNVGNVLNSLNVSATVLANGVRQSKAESLGKLAALLLEHRADLAHFLSRDPKGRRIPEFLRTLALHFVAERNRLLKEIVSLQKNIDHIKEIVSMQQAYATMIGVVEPIDPEMLMEDALRMNVDALERREIRIAREFTFVPPILADKGKVLQILVNLIRNATFACDDGTAPEKVLTLRITTGSPDCVRLTVQDTGCGISEENLTKIFQHGFTTRKEGHGFGLHSAANAARQMKGALIAHSEGVNRGAMFTLELPAAPPALPVE